MFHGFLSSLNCYYYSFESFSHQLIVSHWSLSDSKSPGLFFSILADLNYVWMIFTCPLISKSRIPFINPVGIVPSTPLQLVLLLPSCSMASSSRSTYLSVFFFPLFYSVVCQGSKVHYSAGFLSLLFFFFF